MHEHEYEAMYALEDFYWWFVARRRLVEEFISTEVRAEGTPRIRDIGCGTGANIKAFARDGSAIGIDASMPG